MSSGIVIVIPAAGQGRRFGGALHKLLQPFGEGTVLTTTLRSALASGLEVVVVTTAALAAEAARLLPRRSVVSIGEADAAMGMGRTIATGVAARSDASGWLVLPADMPLIRPTTLRAVAQALVQLPVAHSQYRGRRGHPVGFGAELFSELRMLSGDEGARRLLARYPAAAVEVDDPGVLLDVDTAADLQAAQSVAQGLAQPVVLGQSDQSLDLPVANSA